MGASFYPSLDTLVAEGAFEDFVPLLPAALLQVPQVQRGRGHRIRSRQKLCRTIVLQANRVLTSLNSVDSGLRTHRTQRRARSALLTPSMSQLHRCVLELAADAVKVRQSLDPSLVYGARATSSLIKSDRVDRYSFQVRSHSQVLLKASALAEPPLDAPHVCMLDALPADEREFYGSECNVLDLAGKSSAIFDSLQQQYGFVSGEYEEYVQYFLRPDVQHLWSWSRACQVKSICGFAAVPKKDPAFQRKLLMGCATRTISGHPPRREVPSE